MSDNTLKPKLKETLDEHIDWVNTATELALAEGADGIKRAIDALEDDPLRGMLFVMVMSRAGDVEQLRKAVRDQFAREQLEELEGDEGPVLH